MICILGDALGHDLFIFFLLWPLLFVFPYDSLITNDVPFTFVVFLKEVEKFYAIPFILSCRIAIHAIAKSNEVICINTSCKVTDVYDNVGARSNLLYQEFFFTTIYIHIYTIILWQWHK